MNIAQKTCIVALAAALSACRGPSHTEVAGAVLAASPIVYVLGVVFMLGLWRLWRELVPRLDFGGPAVHAAMLALLVPTAIWGLTEADRELIPLAVILYGSSVLTWWLVLWRIGLAAGWRRPFTWAGVPPTIISTLPAAIVLIQHAQRQHPATEVLDVGMVIWFWFGGFGLAALVLAAGFHIEAGIKVAGHRRLLRAVEETTTADAPPAPGPDPADPA